MSEQSCIPTKSKHDFAEVVGRGSRRAASIFRTAAAIIATLVILSTSNARADVQSTDSLLDLLVKKGIVTQDEANMVKAETSEQTNYANGFPSKWKVSDGVKSVELFGDLRLRYEDRSVHTFAGDRLELSRFRYAARLGLRGDLAGDFYYGVRVETAANPRSPWVTFGTSSSGTPYNGPFGKSTAGINLGQIYLGWKPIDAVDIEVGKMPQPLVVTPMVWDSDYSPEGAAEKFKYSIGPLDLFANGAQFLYQDVNPNRTAAFLTPSIPFGRDANTPFLLAVQGGFKYNFNKHTSLKAAVSLYTYTGGGTNTLPPGSTPAVPGFSDVFVGAGPGIPVPGASGYPSGPNDGFAFNQTGIDQLLILDIPVQFDFKIHNLNARIFGDFAENLEGSQRAKLATEAASADNATNNAGLSLNIPYEPFDNKAYQFGFAIGNGDGLGLVYGSILKKNMWEFRTYFQHVEQYALDPNLLDSDFFEGRGNLQGIYMAFAYGFSDAVIGTVRYGYATRINHNLDTGGSKQDIPQVNPIKQYQLLQLDLTAKF